MNSRSYSLKRIILTTFGLTLLIIGGIIILLITASRVGEHKASTFGEAYNNFEKSWGGEILVAPPKFFIRKYRWVSEIENGITIRKKKLQDTEIFPEDITLNTSLDYSEQFLEWIPFNAYEASSKDLFNIINTTKDSGDLVIEFNMPQRANLMNKVELYLNTNQKKRTININKRMVIISSFSPGDSTSVGLNYSVKGMDTYQYKLSGYSENVTGNLTALFKVNSPKYQVYQFGIPHTVKEIEEGSEILFSMKNFTSTQSLGIVFYNRIMHIDKMEKMMYYSPIGLALFMLVIFFYSQIKNKRISGIHYIFIAVIYVFYFLFIAYLIRFFGVWLSVSISTVLTFFLSILYFPKVFGKTFFLNIIVPHLLVLTFVFTLIFLMPVFQGISFLVINFLILVTLMLTITNSEITDWQIMNGDK